MDTQEKLNIYKEQLRLILEDSKTAHGEDLVKLTVNLPSLIDIIEELEIELRKQ